MGFIKSAFKKVLGWVFRFIKNRIILAIIGIVIGFLVAEITMIVADILSKMNNILITALYRVENQLFIIQDKVYDVAEAALNWLDEQVRGLMNTVLPSSVVFVLNLVNFAQWIQVLLASLVTQAGVTLDNVITELITPITALINGLDVKTANALNVLRNAQVEVETKINSLNLALAEAVQGKIDTHNALVGALADQVNGLVTWYNNDITTLESHYAGIKAQVLAYNQSLPGKQAAIRTYLIDNLPDGVPLGVIERDAIIAGAVSQAQAYFTTISGFNINWSQYQYALVTDTSFFPLSIETPEWDLTFSIDVTPFNEIASDIYDIETALTAFPSEAKLLFTVRLPQTIIAALQIEIRLMLILAIKKMVERYETDMFAKFSEFKRRIEEEGKETAAYLQAKTDEIKAQLLKAQLDLIEKLPELLRPSVVKSIEKTKKKLLEAKEELLSEADDLLDWKPDLSKIKSIYEGFPQGILPHEIPNIADAQEWSIQDVYRVLCDYFYRTERLALIAKLSQDDIQVELPDLYNLITKVGE